VRAPAACQLPAAVPDFAGRDGAVAEASAVLSAAEPGEPPAVRLVGISGPPGIGKTALAVHLAHRLRPRYPDGQLYAELRGGTPQPAHPAAALAWLLGGLGVDGAALPAELDRRAALLRSRLDGRRVLLVLDDAVDAAQVRPLLPGTPGCGVLVTSRRRLVGLPGLHDVSLPLLDPPAATDLLRRGTPDRRTAGDPAAEAEIVALCGGLPLALRIAGSRLAARPHWPPARLRDALRDERRRLDELTAGDLEVRASLAASYRSLSGAAGRLLRGLAAGPPGDIPAWSAAAVLGGAPSGAEAAADELIDARLLEPVLPGRTWTAGHLRMHDLTRLFAVEQAEAEDTAADRRGSLTRVLHGWLGLTRHAVHAAPSCAAGAPRPLVEPAWSLPTADRDRLVGPGLGWLDAERGCLLAAVEHAAATGFAAVATELTLLLAAYYSLRGLLDDWQAAATAAQTAATRSGYPARLAGSTRTLGELRLEQGRLDEGAGLLATARDLSERAGDRHGHALAGLALAYAARAGGDPAAAEAGLRRTTAELDAAGDPLAAAHGTAELGLIHQQTGRLAEAADHLHAALEVFRAHRHTRGEALVLRRLGMLSLRHGDAADAHRRFTEAERIYDELGDRRGSAECAYRLGTTALGRGDLVDAEAHLTRAATLLRGIGDHRAEAYTTLALGQLHHRAGRDAAAAPLLRRAHRALTAAGDHRGAAQAQEAARALAAIPPPG
jgi:tetratricopeptide (TPR) repeat protein